MMDVQATNIKLRARRIVAQAAESATRRISEGEAGVLLERCNGKVRTAIVPILAEVSPEDARQRLATAGGIVRRALRMDE